MIDPQSTADDRAVAHASLRTFMQLAAGPALERHPDGRARLFPAGDRRDHDGHIPAIKAALHRGRARLRELAQEPDDAPAPCPGEAERMRLAAYVDRFNAGDFDALA